MRKADGFEAERILVLSQQFLDDYMKNPLAQNCYMTDIGYYPNAKYHYRERPQGCEEYILILCVDGEGWVDDREGGRKIVRKHDLLVLPPHIAHTYGASADDPWSIHWVHFKGKLAAHYYKLMPLSELVLQISHTDALRMTELLESCYTHLAEKGYSPPHSIYANLLLQQLLGMVALQTEFESNQASNIYVEQSIAHMKQHVTQQMSLAELANQVNLSRSHYLSIFKEVTGSSPMQYFVQLKVRHACTYLDLTGWTVKEIGGKLGFNDALYFSRIFRKVMGLSPTKYRQRKKG